MVTEKMIEAICRSPTIEVITPTTEQWDRCETIQDRYDLMKRLVRSAFETALSTDAEPVKTVAEEIADAVLSWMVKYDLLDAGNEYQATDILAVLDDFKPSYHAAPPSPSVAVKPEKLPVAFEVLDTENGTYLTRSEQAAIKSEYEYNGLYRRDGSALSAQVQDVATITPSIDTMRDAAKELILKNGWQPNHRLSPHSVAGLMAEFGMKVHRGEIGCGYPDCGCCADAACEDAIKQHPDFAVTAAKLEEKP